MIMSKNDIETARNIVIEKQLHMEYEEWLKDVCKEKSPENAYMFAMEKIKISGGYDYMGKKDRDIVLLLEGELPNHFN